MNYPDSSYRIILPRRRRALVVYDNAIADALRSEISHAWNAMHAFRRRARLDPTYSLWRETALLEQETLLTLLNVWRVARKNARQAVQR